MNSLTLILLVPLVLGLLIRYPEVCLALFLFSGTFKAEFAHLSPWLPDITIILALVILAGIFFHRFTGKKPATGKSLVFSSLFALILILMILSTLNNTIENRYAMEKTTRFATLTGLATFAPLFVVQNRQQLLRFLGVSIALGIIMTLTGEITREGLTAFGASHIATGRTIGLGFITVLGMALLRYETGTLSITSLRTSGSQHRQRSFALLPILLYAGSAIVLGYGLLASGSRGALVALLVTIAAVVIIGTTIQRARKPVLTVTMFLVTATIVITIIAPQTVVTMNQRITNTISAPLDQTAHTRVIRARSALEMFSEHPLTGVGVGGFDLLFNPFESERGDYPHNLFLEVAAEMGFIGLILFALLVFLPPYHALTSFRQSGQWTTLLIIAVTIYLLVNALFSGDLNDNRLLFTALGLCLTRKSPSIAPAGKNHETSTINPHPGRGYSACPGHSWSDTPSPDRGGA